MKQFYLDILNEQTPCDGCVHVAKCGSKRLACDAFALYVNNGSVNWTIPRSPNRRTYSMTMRLGDGETSLIRGINKKLRERALA
jgi:hypothetical protein